MSDNCGRHSIKAERRLDFIEGYKSLYLGRALMDHQPATDGQSEARKLSIGFGQHVFGLLGLISTLCQLFQCHFEHYSGTMPARSQFNNMFFRWLRSRAEGI